MKYAWIEKHRRTYSTTMMCELLSVSRSGVHAARLREPSKRSHDDEQLLQRIRHLQHKHRGRYGRRRMTKELSEERGREVNHKRVARVMREHGLQSHKRRAEHWVVVKGVMLCDTYSGGKWQFVVDGPHKSSRLMDVHIVRRKA